MSRAEEFELFKRGKGAEMSRIMTDNKSNLKINSSHFERQKEAG